MIDRQNPIISSAWTFKRAQKGFYASLFQGQIKEIGIGGGGLSPLFEILGAIDGQGK